MNASNTPPADDAIIRQPETSRLVGYCDMQLRRLELVGDFPRRFKLNPAGGPYGAVGWSRTEIRVWIAERRAARHVNLDGNPVDVATESHAADIAINSAQFAARTRAAGTS